VYLHVLPNCEGREEKEGGKKLKREGGSRPFCPRGRVLKGRGRKERRKSTTITPLLRPEGEKKKAQGKGPRKRRAYVRISSEKKEKEGRRSDSFFPERGQ